MTGTASNRETVAAVPCSCFATAAHPTEHCHSERSEEPLLFLIAMFSTEPLSLPLRNRPEERLVSARARPLTPVPCCNRSKVCVIVGTE